MSIIFVYVYVCVWGRGRGRRRGGMSAIGNIRGQMKIIG